VVGSPAGIPIKKRRHSKAGIEGHGSAQLKGNEQFHLDFFKCPLSSLKIIWPGLTCAIFPRFNSSRFYPMRGKII